MEDRFDIGNLPLSDTPPEIVFIQIVGNLPIDQIPEFIAFGQVIDHQNIGIAALVQAAHNIAADKAGASGNNNHDSSPAVTTEVPNLPTTRPDRKSTRLNSSH